MANDIIDINVSETIETVAITVQPNLTTINVNSISTGANLDYTASPTNGIVSSDTGTDATIPLADSTNAGLISPSEKTKLAGIATGAEVNVNADWNSTSGDSQILNKPSIPSIAGLATVTYVDTQDALKVDKIAGKGLSANDFTDVLKTKLDSVESGAEVNVNADWNSVSGDSQILNKPTIPTQTSQLTNNGADGTNPFITALDIPVGSQASSLVREVKNMTGATLTKGTVVYISGANGNKALVSKALAINDELSSRTFGLLQSNISNNGLGNCVIIGDLSGLDTSAFTEGVQLYLSGVTAGTYTSTKTLAPTHLVYVGKVTRSHPTLGQIEVGIQNGYELSEIHDVAISSVANNQLLSYDSVTSLWKNKSVTTSDITDSVNKRYVTDANLTTIGNQSGINTGDETTATIKSKLGITTLSGSNTGDQDLSGYQLTSAKDAVSGYAGLDGSGKINPSQLPALAITDTFVVASQLVMLALTAEVGDIAVRTDLNKSFILRVTGATTLANWQELLTPTDAVSSVFGRSGTVTAQNGDYTTDQVTETATKVFLTPTEKTAITHTNRASLDLVSGTNTGDETITTIKSKLGITTLSGSNTGDQDLSNLVVKNTAIVGATKTKITYDAKGLVTVGADATTADIADSSNKRYQTDNQQSFNDATSSIQTQINSKQSTLTNPITGTGTTNYVSKFNGTSSLTNSNIQDSGTLITLNSNTNITGYVDLDNGTDLVRISRTAGALGRLVFSRPGSTGTQSISIGGANSELSIGTDDTKQIKASGASVLELSNIAGGASTYISAVSSTGKIAFRGASNIFGLNFFSNTRNILLQDGGTFTDAGYRLDVNGTTRVQGLAYLNRVLIGTTTDNGYILDVTGTARVTGQLRLDSTITNNTFTYTLPTATGTLALTSQIPTVSGTTNYLPKFTGASALGNSSIVDNGDSVSTTLPFLVQNNDATINNVKVGKGPGGVSTNTVLGNGALNYNTNSSNNTAIGYQALLSNATYYQLGISSSTSCNDYTNGYYGGVMIGNGVEIEFEVNDDEGGVYNLNIVDAPLNTVLNFTGSVPTTVMGGTCPLLIHITTTVYTPSNNTSLGYSAGANNSYGNTSVFIGANAQPSFYADNNQIVIGANTTGLGSNTVVIGNSSITNTYLRGNVNIGATNFITNAILNLQSTTKGFLPPKMTTTQKNLITNPSGLVVFDTTLNKLCVRGVSNWETITSI